MKRRKRVREGKRGKNEGKRVGGKGPKAHSTSSDFGTSDLGNRYSLAAFQHTMGSEVKITPPRAVHHWWQWAIT